MKKLKKKFKRHIKWWKDDIKVELDDIEHTFWTNREIRWKRVCKN